MSESFSSLSNSGDPLALGIPRDVFHWTGENWDGVFQDVSRLSRVPDSNISLNIAGCTIETGRRRLRDGRLMRVLGVNVGGVEGLQWDRVDRVAVAILDFLAARCGS